MVFLNNLNFVLLYKVLQLLAQEEPIKLSTLSMNCQNLEEQTSRVMSVSRSKRTSFPRWSNDFLTEMVPEEQPVPPVTRPDFRVMGFLCDIYY